jgi:hypothetical protein
MEDSSVQDLVCVVSCDTSNHDFSLFEQNIRGKKNLCGLILEIVNMIKFDVYADKYCFGIGSYP